MAKPLTIEIWPRIISEPHILRFARDDMKEIGKLFEDDPEFFGASISIALTDQGKRIPTNRISPVKTGHTGRLTTIVGKEGRELAPALMDMHHGQVETMVFTLDHGRRELPDTHTGIFYNVLYSRNAIFCTAEGFRYAERMAVDTAEDGRLTWGGLLRSDAALSPAQHRAAASCTKTMHYGSSVLTVLVNPDDAADSNHARLAWIEGIRRDIRKMLTYRSVQLKKLLVLHPDWDPGACLETPGA